mgnify:CR=1 FL=1
MPMNKRTESIRLKHLQDIYYEKLQGIAYDVYDEQLHNLIIRPEELDADIHRYFRHTQPSLHGNTFMKWMKHPTPSFSNS